MRSAGLFDTHAHYDHPLFAGEGPGILRGLLADGTVSGAVIPAVSYDSCFHRELFPREAFPRVFFAPGLHPRQAVNEAAWDREKRERFAALLEDDRTVAVKTGLDFCKKRLTEGQKAHQTDFFRYLLGLANDRGLPLVLHVRDAWEETLRVLAETPPRAGAVVHCYTGDPETAQALLNVGVTRFGIGGKLTLPEWEGLRDCVRALPLSRLLLETDAPFVKPAGYTGALNTSVTLAGTLGLAAELKEMDREEARQALERSAEEFYGIP